MGIDINGRVVYPITSEAGQKDYYEHLNYWWICYQNSKQLIIPSQEDALAYIKLQARKPELSITGILRKRTANT